MRGHTELTAPVKRATDVLDEIHLHVANSALKLGAEMGASSPTGRTGTAPAEHEARPLV